MVKQAGKPHVCRACAKDNIRAAQSGLFFPSCLPALKCENAQRGGRSVLSEEEGREARQPGPPRVASSQLAHEERQYGSVV
jgi:hypothetical protein